MAGRRGNRASHGPDSDPARNAPGIAGVLVAKALPELRLLAQNDPGVDHAGVEDRVEEKPELTPVEKETQ